MNWLVSAGGRLALIAIIQANLWTTNQPTNLPPSLPLLRSIYQPNIRLRVFEPSINAWSSGQTPNPDVGCNR